MRYGVLGTGMVGEALGRRLVGLGHEVMMGARVAGGSKAVAWVESTGSPLASEGSFASAAAFAEVVVNATSGMHSLEALHAAGAANLRGKVLVDVANPIAHDSGFPPVLGIANDDSLGEQIQRAFPEVRVVKTLNTVNCNVMVDPSIVPGRHSIFVGGEDAGAKAEVTALLHSFGWPEGSVIDLGGIETSRGTEMYLALWLRMMVALERVPLNIAVHRAG